MKKIKIGFIGNGKSVNRYHLPYLLARKDKYEVKTIFSINDSGIWKKQENVKYTEDLDELLNDSEIDVISVNTPSCAHYELAKKVLEAGKNCIVEKPFTHKSAEAKELFDLAKSKNLILQAYQNRRFDSDFLTVLKVIESGKLGNVFQIESCFDYYRPEMPNNVKEYSKETSFIYGHCHSIDQIISYYGEPKSINYDLRQLLGENRMNDYFDIDMNYDGLKVSIKSSFFIAKPRPSFTVYGTKGTFIKEKEDQQEKDLKHFYLPENHPDFGVDQPEDYGTLIYYDENNTYHEEKVLSEIGDYGRYYDALYDTLVFGKDVLVKPSETICLIKILEESTAKFDK